MEIEKSFRSLSANTKMNNNNNNNNASNSGTAAATSMVNASHHAAVMDPSRLEKISKWSDDLNDFLFGLDSYSPTVPEAAIRYTLQKNGLSVQDPRILKLVGLATDKFLTDVIKEATEMSKIRKSSTNAKRKGSGNDDTLEQVCAIYPFIHLFVELIMIATCFCLFCCV